VPADEKDQDTRSGRCMRTGGWERRFARDGCSSSTVHQTPLISAQRRVASHATNEELTPTHSHVSGILDGTVAFPFRVAAFALSAGLRVSGDETISGFRNEESPPDLKSSRPDRRWDQSSVRESSVPTLGWCQCRVIRLMSISVPCRYSCKALS